MKNPSTNPTSSWHVSFNTRNSPPIAKKSYYRVASINFLTQDKMHIGLVAECGNGNNPNTKATINYLMNLRILNLEDLGFKVKKREKRGWIIEVSIED